MKLSRQFCCLILLLGMTGSASASHISLETRATSRLENGRAGVSLDITNKGDEPATAVSVDVEVGGRTVSTNISSRLDVQERASVSLDLGPAPEPAGIHTIVIRLHYADTGGYPFTAISSIRLVTDVPNRETDWLTVAITSSKVKRRDEIVLNLATVTDSPVPAHIRLIVPSELRCSDPELDVIVPPREFQKCRFEVENVSGLPGSTYSILAVVDFVHKGQHWSATTTGSINIKRPEPLRKNIKMAAAATVAALLAVFLLLQFFFRSREEERAASRTHGYLWLLFELAILAGLAGFTLMFIPPAHLLLNTTTAGGDTPAHNYMASHLADQLLHHGRIISWADGWWCGFPLFQFYFSLPYLLMALISTVIPFNIAFKLVTVLGIFCLPACAYGSARLMRLPRPGPILVAIATIPLLFDSTHTMWGVNIFSTLAGMIANSISFAIMLLAIGSVARDTDDGTVRIRTILLLVALIASHFFTTVVAGLTMAALPFMRPKAGWRRAFTVLTIEGAMAFLLMAWWLVPLVLKQAYTVDFGSNWNLKQHSPPLLALITLLAMSTLAVSLLFVKYSRFVVVFLWMLIASTVLMFFGYQLAPVFVNVRLWPFAVYALLALSAAGVGIVAARLRCPSIVVVAALLGVLTLGTGDPSAVHNWSRWNYEGIEKKPRWQVLERLVVPLEGTPGRLANDLHEDNDSLGSSRIFETVPHLIGKPILEGGIVGSGANSIFSYYIQSETSKNCAGFPEIVKPTTFNFTNATMHLELFNVKHFVARWTNTQSQLALMPEWRKLAEEQGWQLYELLTHDGSYVFVPDHEPRAVVTRDFRLTGLEWIYTIQALNQPYVFLSTKDKPLPRWGRTLSEKEFNGEMMSLRTSEKQAAGTGVLTAATPIITGEEVSDGRIRFHTSGIGLPHIIKMSYYPNWKVRGAKRIHHVTPGFMLVYPDQNEVELYYGSVPADIAGRTLAWIGLALLCGFALSRAFRKAPAAA